MNRAWLVCAALAILGSIHASALPAAAEARHFYTNGKSSGCIPFDTTGIHVDLPGTMNGQPMNFTLDSGSSGCVIDAEKAKAIGLVAHGSNESLGAGGPQQGSEVDSVSVALPGFEMRDLWMDTLDLRAISAQSAKAMDGILGHQFFTNCIVEIDYLKGCVTFSDPATWRYTGKGAVLPLHFKENHPYVTSSVGLPGGRTLTGEWVIDTGSAGVLILAADVVERENLIVTAGRTVSSKAQGVGRGVDLRTGRVERFDLGPFSFAKPIATFQPTGAGRVSAPGTLGNIGNGILNRFKVTFDYPHKRMILEPNDKLHAPFEVDMSGMAVVSAPPDYRLARVAHVMDDSPAASAGVRAGDEITKVNGVPASEIGVQKIRRMMKVENRELKLDLKRGEEPVSVTIRTRRML
jgi:Aspartyl protease/PDZ domain